MKSQKCCLQLMFFKRLGGGIHLSVLFYLVTDKSVAFVFLCSFAYTLANSLLKPQIETLLSSPLLLDWMAGLWTNSCGQPVSQ